MIKSKNNLFSGIQPSGKLTIGNYFGALKQWVEMQHDFHCYYSIVDLHSITVNQNPTELRKNIYDCLAILLAIGIDPDKSVLFLQSHIQSHTFLSWILNCLTYMGELNRMTQFKDKSKKHPENINAGLFSYPVLQAADILLYNSHRVPIGEDQKQHLELCRDLAIRFNTHYGQTFNIPDPVIPKEGARIMSLQEPNKKMSKSDSNINSYIALLDPPDQINDKIKKSVTDSGKEIRFDPVEKPGLSNLLILFSLASNQPVCEIENNFQGKGYGIFKSSVAEAIIEFLKPIQIKFHSIRKDEVALNEVLAKGQEKAQKQAKETIKMVVEKIGLINL